MDQLAVIADAGLLKTVKQVVLETGRGAVRRIFVTRTMEVGNTGHVLAEDSRQIDLEGSIFRQRHVARMKIPQGREDPLTGTRVSQPKGPGKNLTLLPDHGLIAFINALAVFLIGARFNPGAQVSCVLIQQIVNAFNQAAANKSVFLPPHTRAQRLQDPTADGFLVNLPAIPSP